MNANIDIIVIGGGPSGLMASIAAAGGGASVLLIDKGDKLGRKLGISGGGRCNVTNAKEIDEIIRHIPGNGRFLHSALAQFGNRDIIAFFEALGIRLKEEDNGRMFPVSDKAKTVVDALIGKARSEGVRMLVNRPVAEVLYEDGHVQGVRLADGETIASRAVVIATGGKSVPHTGSTGDGYPWASHAGHTITELYPTEVPLTSDEPWIRSRELQGVSLRSVGMTVWNAKGKKLIRHDGDMIFTHFGLSGPIALRCSQFVLKALKQAESKDSHAGEAAHVLVTIDMMPDKNEAEVYDLTLRLAKDEPKRAVKNVLRSLFQERVLLFLLRESGLSPEVTYDNINRQAWTALAQHIKGLPVRVNGTLSIEEAFVTGGGVALKDVDPRTMRSKLMQGLYFCGEVLDIHGYTGGYNITAAFTTGYTAGSSAAADLAE
jgi:predicted Rossmann fold flavoprotein